MEDYHNKLFPYAYNILGSVEDAKDAVQDVLLKYYSSMKSDIDNLTGYLVKSVINQSINIKNRKKKISYDKIWLPEPIATDRTDKNLKSDEIISYTMLVLLEQLNPRERAVFILKEAFHYSHLEIANFIDFSIENSRTTLKRAKQKLKHNKKDITFSYDNSTTYMQDYIHAIKNGNIDVLESMLSEEISLAADGGEKVSIVRSFTFGKKATSDLIQFVYNSFQKSRIMRIAELNHQPALLFYDGDTLKSCQVFEFSNDNSKIERIFSIVDPDKLKIHF